MPDVIIEIEQLNLKINSIELLKDFSFQLHKGQRIGITGPSGCGKSTLIKSLIKNTFPVGTTFLTFRKKGSSIYSYIPQSNGLLPWFSLKRNLRIFTKDNTLYTQVIQQFKLSNSLNNFPHQLSGGEYQRALLAAAIINCPDVYLVDEPLTELDITNKWDLLSFWSNQIRNAEATLLLVSHDIETLIYLCDKVIVLSDKPSRVIKEFAVTEPHPRQLDFLVSDTFTNSKKHLLKTIEGEH